MGIGNRHRFRVAVATLLYAILGDRRAEQAGYYQRAVKTIAGFSFTLYAIHIPILIFVRLCLTPSQRWHPTGPNLAIWSLIVCGVILTAYACSRVTEANTDAVRRFILRRLAAKAIPVAALVRDESDTVVGHPE